MAFFAKKELRLVGISERVEEGFVEVLPGQVMSHGFVNGVDTVVVIVDAAGNDLGFGYFIGAVNADDFFDEIDIALQVLAVGRDGNFPTHTTISFVMYGNAYPGGIRGRLAFQLR